MNISAQVSLYPLRQKHLSPAIDDVLAELRRHDVAVEPGAMSTLLRGDSERVFRALREAFHQAGQRGHVVMAVTLSNACPPTGDAQT
ncbi:MAG TPA: YkoF family thiamine/hydroxymethylpyrimidine-binding protein [Verrucomicrobiae bacterium]|nr:YkoF family thiamine/hydroxymethylpyrimidine-binding protein [Verrucomicrobiae bacterium]